jgi:hypothetical protein
MVTDSNISLPHSPGHDKNIFKNIRWRQGWLIKMADLAETWRPDLGELTVNQGQGRG